MNNFEDDYRKFANETVPSYWDSIQKKIEESNARTERDAISSGKDSANTEESNAKTESERIVSPKRRRRRLYYALAAAAACIACVGLGARFITGISSHKTESVASNEAAEAPMAEEAAGADVSYDVIEEEYEEAAPAEEAAYADEAATEAYEVYPMEAPKADTYDSGYYLGETSDQYDKITESDFFLAATDPLSTFSADVDTASYGNIRNMINSGYGLYDIPNDSVRIEELINYFDYDIAGPEGDDKFGVSAEIGECPWNPSHKLLMIGARAEEAGNEDTAGENLTFLIDVSGSMSGSIEMLKDGFEMLVDELDENDTVSIVTYASGCEVVLDSAKGSDKAAIKAAIRSLNANGSTYGEGGIKLAYELAEANYNKDANNRIILATDGDLNVGISDPDQLQKLIESKRDKGIFLTVLGFDNYNYHDANLERIADYGNGNYYYIDSRTEAGKVMVEDLTKTLHTVAKDVKFQVEFNPAVVNSYHLIGYDNRMLEAQDFKDDKKDAGEVGSGDEVIVLYELIMEGSEDGVDLKYQDKTGNENASSDICTVKVRYKEPDENESKEDEYIIDSSYLEKGTGSEFGFASAVAEFGLVLRNSRYKASASLESAADRAKENINNDVYRAEFVSLAKELGYSQ